MNKHFTTKALMLVAIMGLFSTMAFSQMQCTKTKDPVSIAQNTFNASTLKLRTDMRFLWSQHMEWTYADFNTYLFSGNT